jgi:hypothetical protein
MAENFVDAVKKYGERLARMQEQPDPDEIVKAAVAATYPVIVDVVKKNNVEIARAFRNNPELVNKR